MSCCHGEGMAWVADMGITWVVAMVFVMKHQCSGCWRGSMPTGHQSSGHRLVGPHTHSTGLIRHSYIIYARQYREEGERGSLRGREAERREGRRGEWHRKSLRKREAERTEGRRESGIERVSERGRQRGEREGGESGIERVSERGRQRGQREGGRVA